MFVSRQSLRKYEMVHVQQWWMRWVGAQVRFWDGDKLELIKAFSQQYSVESASFCPEKGRFVAGGGDMWAHLHDYETGAELECNRGKRCISRLSTHEDAHQFFR